MAKKKTFGTEGEGSSSSDRRMAKVIVATKTDNNKYGYKEAIIDQDDVKDFIKENKEN
ncbi:DUF4295 family protein [Fodinibius saliphilus]|uniref:DUF4295 family protein n=1 Tax=Fodinibius saliphilus TaxID=1920650 RepID=UPI0011087C3F|nr:DUF4295 family protein [Fodinibius saliphilus]